MLLDIMKVICLETIKNLTSLKGALKDFKLPELPESELTFGAFFRGLFGEDFAGELESIDQVSH